MMQPSATGMVPPPLDQQQQQQQQQQYQYQQQPPQQPPQQPSQQPPPPQPYMMMPPAGHPSQAPPPPQMWAAHQPLPAMPQQAAPGGGGDEVRTLWIGDLQYWMDEAYLGTCFAATGEVANVKVIRNKQTMQPEGYGFIEFYTRAAAERVLQTYNGAIMPNGGQSFRLNWASAGEKRADDTPDYTIFVGDLASDVTDYMLQEMFRGRYPSVRSAKVVMDRLTSRTKGYGFVKFGDESEQIRAMSEMNGVFLSTRPMRIGLATNKKIATGQQYQKASYQNTQVTPNETDPNNKTVFVGGLDPNVTDDHLRQVFGQYGEIVQVKIPPGKRCGFVQFADRSCAEEALRMLNGTQLGGQNIRLSWGRSPANKQPQSDPSQYGGYYGYAAGYENYGYGAASQDANMYYGGYAGYANYQQPQQQQQQQQQLGYS
ncbi:hypothetical protein EUGRSUZ_D01310 [Eucalyptus grandis]|uniref:RRM domain-containing protein n=1 Tax=Eucalyptus grandis TaxID=71139 RepID=A0A059CFF8_EUCGR|nr:hypothetical protein EUGRSUZ_D01310 [Eucalyptus grandis]